MQVRTTAKSDQLQIRVSAAEKAAIQRAARRAGLDMSAYVLARVLPAAARRFEDLTEACRDPEGARFGLAELSSWLSSLSAGELREAVRSPPAELTPQLANYIAAMVEYACGRQGIAPPTWTRAIAPLTEPVFGSTLMSLRLHLLTQSPPPFRRRNIFIDASVGSHV
jgi:Mobilization protein NikA